MGCIIIRTRRHAKTTPIAADEYLRNKVSKEDTSQGADRFYELVDWYMKLYELKEGTKKLDAINYDPVMSNLHTEHYHCHHQKRKGDDRN